MIQRDDRSRVVVIVAAGTITSLVLCTKTMMTNMTAGGEEDLAYGRQVTNQPAVTWQPIGRVGGSCMSPSTTNNQEEGGGGGGAS